MDEEVASKLDLLIGLYELVNADALEQSRTRLKADPVVAAILDAAEDWVATGQLKTAVSASTAVSEKTVQRRIAQLSDQKVLLASGSGASRVVKTSGIV